ncbi:MAG TPA: response regulator [Alkalispirochaeta sp.]|nr:response regulator [Alkalispirochaeta sp.]
MSSQDESVGTEILVVEDEQIVALDIRVHLERLGYTVGGSFSAAERLIDELKIRRDAARLPDLVLMDIHLDGQMDGVSAAGVVRAQFHIPVILLTAYADDETLDRAKVSEPYAYIIKPFEEQELRTAVVLALYRNRMERAVQSREALLSRILGSIDDGVLVSDQNGIVRYANAQAGLILHTGSGDYAAISDLIPEDIQHSVLTHDRPIRWSPPKYSGGIVDLSVAVLGSGQPEGEDHLTVWVLADITERMNRESEIRRKDAQLAHAERMDAIGRMSGGLAHDFNNLVTVIMGYTRLVLDDLDAHPELEAIRTNVQGVYDTARRSAQLSRQLLAFSRTQPPITTKIRPDDIILEIRSMIDGLIPEYVKLDVYRRGGDVAIQIDRTRFERIILNLLLNARDAIHGGGEISLSSEVISLVSPLPTMTRTLAPGDFYVMRVSDSGHGIVSEDLHHVFEPFFTTKETEWGSGFGLATVYSAVAESNGAIDVTSTRGQGTTFTVYIPVTSVSSDDREVPQIINQAVSGTEQILVVQEEEAMRSLIGNALRSRGFVPVIARSVGDALLALERNSEVDLVVSDLSAPFLDAAEIVARYRAIHEIPVVLIVTGESVEAGQQATVHKPFELDGLLTTIREAIDARC